MSNSTIKYESVGKMTLLTLVSTRFINGTPGILFSLLLIEIGTTFGTPVGVTGQIRTASQIMAVISALLMGVISVRYNIKSLLMIGISLFLISALGCCISTSYGMMLLFYTLTGIGMAIITPMSSTLVAEYYPREERTQVLGWMIAGGASTYLIGAQVISLIAGVGGWRLAYIGYVIPIILIGLFLAQIFLPYSSEDRSNSGDASGFFEGLKEVMSKGSVIACLVGTMFRMASFQVVLLYATSLIRHQFSISRGIASILMTGAALSFIVGSVLSSRVVEKFRRKMTTILSILLAGTFTMVFTISSYYWIAIVSDFISAFFFGMAVSAGQSLNLEQVPRFRGSMMSMSSATGNIGSALGSGIGGMIILMYNYNTLGVVLGSLGFLSALFVYFAKEPAR